MCTRLCTDGQAAAIFCWCIVIAVCMYGCCSLNLIAAAVRVRLVCGAKLLWTRSLRAWPRAGLAAGQWCGIQQALWRVCACCCYFPFRVLLCVGVVCCAVAWSVLMSWVVVGCGQSCAVRSPTTLAPALAAATRGPLLPLDILTPCTHLVHKAHFLPLPCAVWACHCSSWPVTSQLSATWRRGLLAQTDACA